MQCAMQHCLCSNWVFLSSESVAIESCVLFAGYLLARPCDYAALLGYLLAKVHVRSGKIKSNQVYSDCHWWQLMVNYCNELKEWTIEQNYIINYCCPALSDSKAPGQKK